MPINPAGDKQRYYVSCWANGYPANDEEAAVDVGDQHEWHSTMAVAQNAMNRLFDGGAFKGVYIIDCGVDEYEVIDYLEQRQKKKDRQF